MYRCLSSDLRLAQLALRTHPDKNPDNPEATAEFQRIGEAYTLIAKHLTGQHRGEYGDYSDDEYDDYDFEEAMDLADLLYVGLLLLVVLVDSRAGQQLSVLDDARVVWILLPSFR